MSFDDIARGFDDLQLGLNSGPSKPSDPRPSRPSAAAASSSSGGRSEVAFMTLRGMLGGVEDELDELVEKQSRWTPAFKVGQMVECMWVEDGLYYRAQVQQVGPKENTYCVLFTEYGNTQEDTLEEWMKLTVQEQLQQATEAKKKPSDSFLMQNHDYGNNSSSSSSSSRGVSSPLLASAASRTSSSASSSFSSNSLPNARSGDRRLSDGSMLSMASAFDKLIQENEQKKDNQQEEEKEDESRGKLTASGDNNSSPPKAVDTSKTTSIRTSDAKPTTPTLEKKRSTLSLFGKKK